MNKLTVDFSKKVGKIKIMHGVNNGPISENKVEQSRGNFSAYKAAKIPFARTHDSSFCSDYGGPHIVDVHQIFPDFTANPYDPYSYDFVLTDDYIKTMIEAGTQVFYRLGSGIEHAKRKYGTIVPADFHKWAVICEHIIRHYNEGWANGFFYEIKYWEIWNEPDGVQSSSNRPNWSGTNQDFYEFYIETSTYLKSRFPHLKIGGPAVTGASAGEFIKEFLGAIRASDKKVPLDFFSHHSYTDDPNWLINRAELARKYLDEFGFYKTESILNEYNYLEGWTDKFVSTIENIIGMRGAAFTASCMLMGQKSSLDMLMYYDARPSVWNGMFDFYTLRPLKGYYPFVMYSTLYELGTEIQSTSDEEKTISIVAAQSENGDDKAIMISYFPLRENRENKVIEVEILSCDQAYRWSVSVLDEENTMTENVVEFKENKLIFNLKANTVLLLKNQKELAV